jgi:hypothetical protein
LPDGSHILTHSLLPHSPAIDAGDPTAVTVTGGVPQFDQRGTPFTRVYAGRIDIGAVEFQPNPLPGDYDFNGFVDAADDTVWQDKFWRSVFGPDDLRADGDANGVVNSDDYNFWKSHFGNILVPRSAGTRVPQQIADPEALTTSGPAPHSSLLKWSPRQNRRPSCDQRQHRRRNSQLDTTCCSRLGLPNRLLRSEDIPAMLRNLRLAQARQKALTATSKPQSNRPRIAWQRQESLIHSQ